MKVMTAKYPKTKEGLIALIIKFLAKSETTYVSFCVEMEVAQAREDDPHLLNYFCNNRCAIHKQHSSQQLLCLPISCRKVLCYGETK